MPLARRLSLMLVLLVIPSAGAAQQPPLIPSAPCNTFTDRQQCVGLCDDDVLTDCSCYWDNPDASGGFPQDMSNCTANTTCCWNAPCSQWSSYADPQFPTETACFYGSGGLSEGDPGGPAPSNCVAEPATDECHCRPPLVPVPYNPDGGFAVFDCTCPFLTLEEWKAQGGVGSCEPPALDHFTLYKAKTTKGAAKFVRFGPVVLTDVFRSNVSYQVTKPARLGLPANKNGEGVSDADTHREEYQVKPVAGAPKFAKRSDVHVVNQCNDLLIEVVKPVSLLVPTAKSLTDPVAAPDPVHHNLEHFLCYQAKAQAKLADGTALPKFPKGTQVDVEDQFQTRRYDLVKLTKLCTPVDKAGTPTLLAGPDKGDPKPITPAVRVVPDDHLLCYQARLATKHIAQSGCGAADPEDKGTTIQPKQAKHAPRIGLHVANQFGAERLDSVKEAELCIPSQLDVVP